MPAGGAPSSPAEQGEAVGEPLEHGRQRAVDQRGRGELDGQRHAVEVGDQLGDRRRVLVGEPEPRPDEGGPLREQPDGRDGADPCGGQLAGEVDGGSGASRQTASPSMSSGSRLVTSTDRCGQCSQAFDQRGDGVEQVLAVVQEQEHRPGRERLDQQVLDTAPRLLGDTHHGGDRAGTRPGR